MENKQFEDYLTGILNRMGLYHKYEQLDSSHRINVLFFDVDNFKTVNDVFGHKKGDEVLIEFANILKENTPDGSIVTRLGGDEFVVVVPDEKNTDYIASIAEKILEEVRNLKKKDKAFDVISSSVGIVRNYDVVKGLDDVLSRADKAMYYAKEQGKDAFVFYEDFEETIEYEKDIKKDVVKALGEGRIIVKYHPIMHLQSSRIVSTEACCLWKRLDGTVLGRNDFRPILVQNEYINEVDMFVFEQVCKDYSKYENYNTARNKICIQFSHLLLIDENRMNAIYDVMKKYDVQAEFFELNFDESIFSGRIATNKIITSMKKLKDSGFSIALSHFGEDCSSVKYLRELPLSSVKLDDEFTSDCLKDEEGFRTLKSIIKLGKSLKYTVIASKVDNKKRMIALAECGCDAATGDYFCDKIDVDEYVSFLRGLQKENQDTISFYFKNNLESDKGIIDGIIVGEDIKLVKGITDKWGAVSFPGGPSQTNYIKIPPILVEGDYTISMWVNPKELQNWVSAIYIRYQGGFASFMPNVAGGRSMYRVNEDAHLDVWYDAMTKALEVGRWNYVTASYDSFTSTMRLYINGEMCSIIPDVPNMGDSKEIWLGGDVFQNSYCGLISALQISSVTLESDEIRKRYEEFKTANGYVGNEVRKEIEHTEIEVHDPAIFEDSETNKFYIYGTGAVGYSSSDLVHWKSIGTVVKETLQESKSHTKSDSIWAPDIIKVSDEYRLYCSNSSWGVRQSCIFMAVADNPAGPFIPKATVLKTTNEDDVNAIDANIIEDHKTKEQYMVYGSFWGGIHILKLDKETGLALEGQGLGKQIACRPSWNDGAIEGPYIIYHPDTEYYYLFVSYGSLTCDYNIRVGRSKSVTGPYTDYYGRELTDTSDESCSTGLMISCGYKYTTGQAYMAPGHNSVLLRDNGEMFLVNHIRKLSFNADPGPGLLQIRKMVMTPDGWPIALGQPYNAETLLVVRDELLIGEYERIELRPSIPQGIQHAHPMKILADGRLEIASVIGKWKRTGTFEMELKYGPITEYVHFEKGLDKEKNKTTVVMCGLTNQGICTWGKKEELIYQ